MKPVQLHTGRQVTGKWSGITTLVDAVRCYVDDQPRSWDKYLSPLAGALRSAVNRNTGFTPNRLMLGREVNIPATLMYKPPESFQNRGMLG